MTKDKTVTMSRRLAETLMFWLGRAQERNEAQDIPEYLELRALLAAPVVERQDIPRKFLISYRTPSGFGRFFNDRQDGSVPSEENIVSMESKLEAQHGVQCTILQVTEISACLDKVKDMNR